MKPKYLLNELDIINEVELDKFNTTIKGIADSSIDVSDDYVFVAIKGFKSDGHAYIEDAVKKGACLIVGEKAIENLAVPYIQVKNSRKALGIIAKNFYGDPSLQKLMIGITGTNGKTTTSYMLKQILEQNGKSCTLVGTIEYIVNGETRRSFNTTPGSLALNKLLSESNDEVVIMEVSSHGLSQHRVEGISFDFCLFTNLDYEHLDYHGSMEEYFQTKMLLFDHLKEDGYAIVNTDNSWGKKLKDILTKKGKKVYAIGQSQENQIQIIHFNVKNSIVTIAENITSYPINSALPGIHNMYNTVMAYGTTKLLGAKKEKLLQSMNQIQGVNGRFETFHLDNGVSVLIDYAHTRDAIYHCLTAAKAFGSNRIIHVFGFRGDRDKGKRKEMLAITSKLSDQYILTLDDLNSVSQHDMVKTLNNLNQTYGSRKGMIMEDRTMAIKQAIEHSNQGDWIIITGKGHEKYQQNFLMQTKSDKETVMSIIRQQKEKEASRSLLKYDNQLL